jgi:hypothetical protein
MHRDAIARCNECNNINGCGFCLSSLQCMSGAISGPSDGAVCPSWTYLNASCPGTIIFLIFSFSPSLSEYWHISLLLCPVELNT